MFSGERPPPTCHASLAGFNNRVIWASCPTFNLASGLLSKDQDLGLSRAALQGQTLPAYLGHKGRRMHARVLRSHRPAIRRTHSLHTEAGLTVSPLSA